MGDVVGQCELDHVKAQALAVAGQLQIAIRERCGCCVVYLHPHQQDHSTRCLSHLHSSDGVAIASSVVVDVDGLWQHTTRDEGIRRAIVGRAVHIDLRCLCGRILDEMGDQDALVGHDTDSRMQTALESGGRVSQTACHVYLGHSAITGQTIAADVCV